MNYDNALDANMVDQDVLYHFAADDYIDPNDVENTAVPESYEIPLDQTALASDPRPIERIPTQRQVQSPNVPRRPSIENKYSTIQRPLPAIPAPVSWRARWGIIGLLGLIGLVGLVPSSQKSSPDVGASNAGSACVPGMVSWYAGTVVPDGYIEAKGQSLERKRYPDLAAATGATSLLLEIPDLRNKYIRGGSPDAVNTQLDASIDASSISASVQDPGHSHIDSGGFSMLRDGEYSLAHLYTFTADGINLKDAGPAITPAQSNIEVTIEGGSETRPNSVVLVPLVCVGTVLE